MTEREYTLSAAHSRIYNLEVEVEILKEQIELLMKKLSQITRKKAVDE